MTPYKLNGRKEFFRATPQEVKAHLAGLSVELLEFHEIPEALQYRESPSLRKEVTVPPKP